MTYSPVLGTPVPVSHWSTSSLGAESLQTSWRLSVLYGAGSPAKWSLCLVWSSASSKQKTKENWLLLNEGKKVYSLYDGYLDLRFNQNSSFLRLKSIVTA